MTLRQRFLQFSVRSMLLAMIVTGVSIQTYRYIACEWKVRKERADFEAKMDQTIAKNHNRPPLCGILALGSVERELEKSPIYQAMPARERSRLRSKLEGERFWHYDRGDQQAVLKTKKPFVKVEDRYRQP